MRFLSTVTKMVFISGKIETIKTGVIDTTDEAMIAYLSKCDHAKNITEEEKPKKKTARSKMV